MLPDVTTITINVGKIRQVLENHQSEVKRLQILLASFEMAGDFAVVSESRGAGRPRNEAAYVKLKEFAMHNSEFTSIDVKEFLNGDGKADAIRAAIAQLISEGAIEEVQKAYGRRIGKYRRK